MVVFQFTSGKGSIGRVIANIGTNQSLTMHRDIDKFRCESGIKWNALGISGPYTSFHAPNLVMVLADMDAATREMNCEAPEYGLIYLINCGGVLYCDTQGTRNWILGVYDPVCKKYDQLDMLIPRSSKFYNAMVDRWYH